MGHDRSWRPGSAARISTAKLRVERFTTRCGRSGFRVAVPGGYALATPAVVGGRIYLGGGFGSREFYCLEATTGEPLWALRLSDDGPSAAVVCEGRVAFNTESCTLFVVDAETGDHVWSRWLGDPLLAQPAAHRGLVCAAYPHQDGVHRLAAFDLHDGALRWEAPIRGDVISAPVIQGRAVYASTFDGTVSRFRLADGALLWEYAMHATSAPWVEGDDLHVSQRTIDGASPEEGFSSLAVGGWVRSWMRSAGPAEYLASEVQARSDYGTTTLIADSSVGFGGGAPPGAKTHVAATNVGHRTVRGLWEYQGSRPTIVNGRSYATQGTTVSATDARTGEKLWGQRLPGDAARLGGHLGSPPAYAGGTLVLGTASGEILALDAATGEVVLRVAGTEPIRFQPALVGGRAYFGTVAGGLVVLETGDPGLDGWTMWGGGPCHNGPGPGAARPGPVERARAA